MGTPAVLRKMGSWVSGWERQRDHTLSGPNEGEIPRLRQPSDIVEPDTCSTAGLSTRVEAAEKID